MFLIYSVQRLNYTEVKCCRMPNNLDSGKSHCSAWPVTFFAACITFSYSKNAFSLSKLVPVKERLSLMYVEELNKKQDLSIALKVSERLY